MHLDDTQSRVVGINVTVLLNLGVKRAVLARCGQCNTPAIVEYAGALIVCGYCGQDTEIARPELIPLRHRIADRFRGVRATLPA